MLWECGLHQVHLMRLVEANPAITLAAAFGKVGAVIGSFAVATGRTLSCGTSITDAVSVARSEFKIYGTWLEAEYASNPQLLRGK